MKTTLHYATFIEAMITTCQGNVYTVDLNRSDLQLAKDWAKNALNDGIEIPSSCISKITFIDSNTGELLMDCERDPVDYDSGDWDYNEDMGFDPYMGCYTDDC